TSPDHRASAAVASSPHVASGARDGVGFSCTLRTKRIWTFLSSADEKNPDASDDKATAGATLGFAINGLPHALLGTGRIAGSEEPLPPAGARQHGLHIGLDQGMPRMMLGQVERDFVSRDAHRLRGPAAPARASERQPLEGGQSGVPVV